MLKEAGSRGERPGLAGSFGFTLVEILVALFVLAVGMLGFASLQGVATKSNAIGGVMSRAVSIGESRMEMLKTARFADLIDTSSTLPAACGETVQVQVGTTPHDFYTVACTITPVDTDADGVQDRVDLLVTVAYPGAMIQTPVRIISSRSKR